MFLLSDCLTYNWISVLVTFLVGTVLLYKWLFTYWQRRGLEYLEPSIPFGNCSKLFLLKCSIGEQFAEFYRKIRERKLKHGGVYMMGKPFYIPADPTIIKSILQKDFSHFVDRGFHVNEEVDPLSGHLFTLEGTKWKKLRAKLTATFTSGKMKMMFETMAACAMELDGYLNTVAGNQNPLDIKETLARFTTDVISSCAFGLDSNCLKNPDTEFRYFGKRIFDNTTYENFKDFMQFVAPKQILNILGLRFNKKDVEDFMMDLVKRTVDYREKNNIYRKDFLHLLLQLKNKGSITDDESVLGSNNKSREIALTINELVAQVFVFFAAGYETSSTAMTFALFELSQNQEIQNKLREEIKTVLNKHNNKITYDAIMEMTYMEQVLNESLRKYPPVPVLNRKCTKAYNVPTTKLHIEEGTLLVIPVMGLHYDPEYFPDPEKFDPDRFSEENKNNIPPFAYLPFGEGPRVCIGLRFGMLQAKLGLTTALKNYKVTLNEKTEIPLKMEPKNIVPSSKTGIWLNVTRLD